MVGEFLEGRIVVGRGGVGDYRELERFHYCGGRPATWAGVWVARYLAGGDVQRPAFNVEHPTLNSEHRTGRVIGVGVLSYPVVCLEGREVFFGLKGLPYRERLRWANGNVRTISRVIVHPQFRGVGVAGELVRWILRECPTRWVEAVAAMGRVNPFFERAGMRRVECGGGRAYFVYGREEGAGELRRSSERAGLR